MKSKYLADPRHSNVQATKVTTTGPPTSSSTPSTASILNNAQNTYISGGSFTSQTINFNATSERSPLDALYRRAAPNAILNAGGRADEVRCHPGTRREVLSRIEEWRDAEDSLTPPIFWLSGPAGAGKTAVAQTIAEHCNADGMPQANFFFFRADASRNNLSPLVATLVHQIIQLYPTLRDPVATVLSTNPLILDSVFEDQLTQLIVRPLEAIRQSSSPYLSPLLLIDGLDECESEEKRSQRQILHAFDKILAKHPHSFRLLVACRDESQIQTAFNSMSCPLLPLYLDGHYSPENDIRTFVNDEFERVRNTHPLAHTLDATWPPVKDVEEIVKKSLGHFIYAATVMRFILDSSASPILSLERVQGAVPISNRSPFAYLDAIYTYILSQVGDQEALKDILHAQLLIQRYREKPSYIEEDFVELLSIYDPKYTYRMAQSCLADLTSIAKYAEVNVSRYSMARKLLFHHASFSDYLLDPSRSMDYYVDLDMFNFKIQPVVWKELGSSRFRGLEIIAFHGLFELRQLPPHFLDTIHAVMLEPYTEDLHVTFQGLHLQHIYSLCTGYSDVSDYYGLLRLWIRSQSPIDRDILQRKSPEQVPCVHRCLAMDDVEKDLTKKPYGHIDISLRPDTDSDARELALWLKNLFHRIYKEKYRNSIQEYNLLLQEWTSWATQNDIAIDGVDDLPKVQWYRAVAHIERNITTEPNGWVDIALRPHSDSDARQTALWLKNFLNHIYGEKYYNSTQEYEQLLRKWISWAAWNDIPLRGVDNLPEAQWYLRRSKIKKWIARYLKPGRRPPEHIVDPPTVARFIYMSELS